MGASRRRGPIGRIQLLHNTIMPLNTEHLVKQPRDRRGSQLDKTASPRAVGNIKPKFSSGVSDFDPISWLRLTSDSPPGCKNEKIYMEPNHTDYSFRCPDRSASSQMSYTENPCKQNETSREDTCDTGRFRRQVFQAGDEHSEGHGSLDETLFRQYDEFLFQQNAAGTSPDSAFYLPSVSRVPQFGDDKKKAGVEVHGKQVNLRRGPKKMLRKCIDKKPPIPERRHLVLRGKIRLTSPL